MSKRPSARVCVHRRLRGIQQSVDSLLELPDALFTGPLAGKPLACQFARGRIDETIAALQQLRQAVDRAEGITDDRMAYDLDPRTLFAD